MYYNKIIYKYQPIKQISHYCGLYVCMVVQYTNTDETSILDCHEPSAVSVCLEAYAVLCLRDALGRAASPLIWPCLAAMSNEQP